jgi:hypothetical protein
VNNNYGKSVRVSSALPSLPRHIPRAGNIVMISIL